MGGFQELVPMTGRVIRLIWRILAFVLSKGFNDYDQKVGKNAFIVIIYG